MANQSLKREVLLSELKNYKHSFIPTSAQLETYILDVCSDLICEKLEEACQKEDQFEVVIVASTMRMMKRWIDAIESKLIAKGKENTITRRNSDFIRLKEKIFVRAYIFTPKDFRGFSSGDINIFDGIGEASSDFVVKVIVPQVLSAQNSITITTKRANDSKTVNFLDKHYEDVSNSFKLLYTFPEPCYVSNEVHVLDFADLMNKYTKEFADLLC